jgi:hypothetical protein
MARTQKRQVSKSAYRPSGSLTGQGGSRYSSAVEFNPDYTHVVSDLKRIGILMGSFTVILVALSFFLK